MKTQEKAKTPRDSLIVVVGCSKMGAAVAYLNSSKGNYTTIIDLRKEAFQKIDADYSGFLLIGDATDQSVLEKAHIKEATQVFIATGDDSTNIYVASLVCCISNVQLVVVRLHDEKKSILLSDTRIKVISPSLLTLEAYKELTADGGK